MHDATLWLHMFHVIHASLYCASYGVFTAARTRDCENTLKSQHSPSHNYSPRGLSVSLSLGVSFNAAASNWKHEDVYNNDDCKLFCDQLYDELLDCHLLQKGYSYWQKCID